MKFNIARKGVEIVPENQLDVAFIEDTLCLKNDKDAIRLVRVNSLWNKNLIEYLTTETSVNKAESTKNPDGTWDLNLDLDREELLKIQRLATKLDLTVNEFINKSLKNLLEKKESENE